VCVCVCVRACAYVRARARVCVCMCVLARARACVRVLAFVQGLGACMRASCAWWHAHECMLNMGTCAPFLAPVDGCAWLSRGVCAIAPAFSPPHARTRYCVRSNAADYAHLCHSCRVCTGTQKDRGVRHTAGRVRWGGRHRKHAKFWHDAENCRDCHDYSRNPPHPRLKHLRTWRQIPRQHRHNPHPSFPPDAHRGAGIRFLFSGAPVEIDGDQRSEAHDNVARCAEQLRNSQEARRAGCIARGARVRLTAHWRGAQQAQHATSLPETRGRFCACARARSYLPLLRWSCARLLPASRRLSTPSTQSRACGQGLDRRNTHAATCAA
jgi:hypothetical protein